MTVRSGYGARRLRNRRWAIVAVLIAALVLLLRHWTPLGAPRAPDAAAGIYRVQRVIDGDTLELVGGERVRLIGADTPETKRPNWPVEPWGPEATEFTRRFLGLPEESRPEVRLEFDGPRRDRYGRLLAYVWVDGRMLNEELIRRGLARARTEFDYSPAMKARFLAAQSEAQQARVGIWSSQSSPEPAGSGRL